MDANALGLAFPLGLALLLLLIVSLVALAMRRRREPFMRSLKEKHVLITGGSCGIGLSIARQALRQQAFVTIVSRSAANLKKAAQMLVHELGCEPQRIRYQAADVSDYKAISAAVREASLWRPIDVVVCNAGLTRSGYLEETEIEDIDLMVRTNILGTFYPLHAALPSMKLRSRHHPTSVVIISSLASLYVLYGHSVYTATKYAVKGLAEALRLELLQSGIKVSLVCPGFVDTALLDDVDKEDEVCETMKIVNAFDRRSAESGESVASYIVEGVKEGEFLVTSKKPSCLLLATLSRGAAPPDSLTTCFLEAFSFFFARMVTLWHTHVVRTHILHNPKISCPH